jgi:hypothetical protein
MTTKPDEHQPKAVLVRMKPSMTREQMVQNVKVASEKQGIEIKPSLKAKATAILNGC